MRTSEAQQVAREATKFKFKLYYSLNDKRNSDGNVTSTGVNTALKLFPGSVDHAVVRDKNTHGDWVPRYGVFNNNQDFIKYVDYKLQSSEPVTAICEHVRCKDKVLAVFDIDEKGLTSLDGEDEKVDILNERVHGELLRRGMIKEGFQLPRAVAKGSREMINNESTERKYKSSFHVAYPTLLFTSMIQLREFVTNISNGLPWLDTNIYHTNKEDALSSFRLVGTHKWDDPTKTALSIYKEKCYGIYNVTWKDFVIGAQLGLCEKQDIDILLVEDVEITKSKKNRKNKQVSKEVCIEKDDHIKKVIRKHIGEDCIIEDMKENEKSGKNSWYVRNNGINRVCLANPDSPVHDSNNCSVYLEGNCLFYKCFHGGCNMRGVLGHYEQEVEKKKFEWPVSALVKDYDESVEYVQPYRPTRKRRNYCVKASMGMGKTYQLERYLERNPEKSCLIIHNRVSLGDGLMGRLREHGFKSYRDKNYNEHRLIIQYESLYHIKRAYDIVVIDEVRSICNNIVCKETNGGNIRENASTLNVLLEKSKQNILMDADLEIDNCVKDLLCSWFSPESIEVARYEYIALKRNMIIYNRDTEWRDSLRKYIVNNPNSKVGVCCRTVKGLEYVEAIAKELNIRYKAYHGKSSDNDKKDWRDPNIVFADVQLVVFTSTITVGADITVEFDRVFVSADIHDGCTARELHQMAHRFRVVKDMNIHTYIRLENLTSAKSRYDEYITALKERKKAMEGTDFVKKMMRDGSLQLMPTAITSVAGYVLDESDRCQFVHRFIDIVYDHGGRIYNIFPEISEECVKTDENLKIIVEKEKVLEKQAIIDDLEKQPVYKYINDIEHYNASAFAKKVVNIHYVQKNFESKIECAYELKKIEYDLQQIKNYAIATRCSEKEIRNIDIRQMYKQENWHDLQFTSHLKVLDYVTNAVTHLGLNHIFDTTTIITKEMFTKNSREIEQNCYNSYRSRCNKPPPKTKASKEWLRVKNTLQRELKDLFGVIFYKLSNKPVLYQLVIPPEIIHYAKHVNIPYSPFSDIDISHLNGAPNCEHCVSRNNEMLEADKQIIAEYYSNQSKNITTTQNEEKDIVNTPQEQQEQVNEMNVMDEIMHNTPQKQQVNDYDDDEMDAMNEIMYNEYDQDEMV